MSSIIYKKLRGKKLQSILKNLRVYFYIKLLLIFFQTSVGQNIPESYYSLIEKADSLYSSKDYYKSGQTYSAAFMILGNKGRITDRYNAAKAWSSANVHDSAFYNLQIITEVLYFADYNKTINESAFKNIHNDKRWEALVESIRLNFYTKPTSWYISETKKKYYKINLYRDSLNNNEIITSIKCLKNKSKEQCTYMTYFEPTAILGKKIKLTGEIKCQNVIGYSCFWMRIDGSDPKKPIAFNDMKDKQLKGTVDWTNFEITLEIPKEASKIIFGALLKGSGQTWYKNVKILIANTESQGK